MEFTSCIIKWMIIVCIILFVCAIPIVFIPIGAFLMFACGNNKDNECCSAICYLITAILLVLLTLGVILCISYGVAYVMCEVL